MSDTDTDFDDVSFVKRSQYRKQTVQALTEQPQMPSEIAEGLDIDMAHISRSLTELRGEGLVELLVADSTKKGRLYGLTNAGENAAEYIQNNE